MFIFTVPTQHRTYLFLPHPLKATILTRVSIVACTGSPSSTGTGSSSNFRFRHPFQGAPAQKRVLQGPQTAPNQSLTKEVNRLPKLVRHLKERE